MSGTLDLLLLIATRLNILPLVLGGAAPGLSLAIHGLLELLSPGIPDVIQHPYLEHLQWGMMSCIRERMKRNGTAKEGGPISSHSLTRGIKRYYVLDASNRTHVTLPCCMHYCYDVSNAVIEPVSKQFHAVHFNYFV